MNTILVAIIVALWWFFLAFVAQVQAPWSVCTALLFAGLTEIAHAIEQRP